MQNQYPNMKKTALLSLLLAGGLFAWAENHTQYVDSLSLPLSTCFG